MIDRPYKLYSKEVESTFELTFQIINEMLTITFSLVSQNLQSYNVSF